MHITFSYCVVVFQMLPKHCPVSENNVEISLKTIFCLHFLVGISTCRYFRKFLLEQENKIYNLVVFSKG